MIHGKFFAANDSEVQKCFDIRMAVFVDEQGYKKEDEFDEVDKYAMFAAVYDDEGKMVGTGRCFIDDDGVYHAGRIAVLKEARGKKHGDFLVRMLCDRAFANGAQEVHIGAQVRAAGFYEKIGFVKAGEEYNDCHVPHVPMILKKNAFCSQCGCVYDK